MLPGAGHRLQRLPVCQGVLQEPAQPSAFATLQTDTGALSYGRKGSMEKPKLPVVRGWQPGC